MDSYKCIVAAGVAKDADKDAVDRSVEVSEGRGIDSTA